MGGWGHTADRVRRWGASRTAYPGSTRRLGARPLSPEARNDPLGMSLGAHTWEIHAGKVDTMALIGSWQKASRGIARHDAAMALHGGNLHANRGEDGLVDAP